MLGTSFMCGIIATHGGTMTENEWEKQIPCETGRCSKHPTVHCDKPCNLYFDWYQLKPKETNDG